MRKTYPFACHNKLVLPGAQKSLSFWNMRSASHSTSSSNGTEHLVIVGSGWGAYRALRQVDQSKYRITVISPKDYFVFTPFLTGASVGSIEDRATIESIRKEQSSKGGILLSLNLALSHILATVTSIDFQKQTLKANPTISAMSNSSSSTFVQSDSILDIELSYDKLIIACGAVVNTFNTPGVAENAYFLKDITDAQAIRSKIMSLFDEAALPGTTEEKRRSLLHFVVVGGGPTGIEFLGELHDLVYNDLRHVFPKELISCVSMSLFDVAPKIMGTFHPSLVEYTTNALQKRPLVSIRTSTSISKISKDTIFVKSPKEEKISYGFLLWATGVAPSQLARALASLSSAEGKPAIDSRSGRLLTDKYLRVLKEGSSKPDPFPNVWAIGDCAGPEHPPTAQVAKQKGEYVGKLVNKLHHMDHIDENRNLRSFSYKDRGYMAYIGEGRAVVGFYCIGKDIRLFKGKLARLLWNTAYIAMLTSWRNRILVPLYWTLTSWLGREISCVKQNQTPK